MRQNAFAWKQELTKSHIQNIYSIRLWLHVGKNMENLSKYKYNHWGELKTLWQKEKLIIVINVSIRQICFQKSSDTDATKSVLKLQRINL